MEFLELAKERYSVRQFDHKKVESEKVNLILETGRIAPTAANRQPQRILVLDTMESLDKLKDCTPYHFNAPLAMLICYDDRVSWKRSYDNKDMGVVDASIVAAHMMFAITNLGLGSTWVAYFNPVTLQTAFMLEEHIIPTVLLPIGYPSEDSTPNARHFERLPKEETVFYNSFYS